VLLLPPCGRTDPTAAAAAQCSDCTPGHQQLPCQLPVWLPFAAPGATKQHQQASSPPQGLGGWCGCLRELCAASCAASSKLGFRVLGLSCAATPLRRFSCCRLQGVCCLRWWLAAGADDTWHPNCNLCS